MDRSLSRRTLIQGAGMLAAREARAQPSKEIAPELWTAAGIASLVRRRKISALEVLEMYLGRIDSRNRELNAFIFRDDENARKAARAIDDALSRGETAGPLAGVPIGVKDLESCAGMPNSEGSLLFKGGPAATEDSPAVARARRAGAVPVGKTAAPEFGLHSITASRAWGVTRNPWNLKLSPGGSSGGSSAAVAAGLVPLATGSDGGGSIRSPASFTGMVGLKVSHGRIGRGAAQDISTSGCLTATVRDTARFLDVAAGPSSTDRTSLLHPAAKYEDLMESLDVSGMRAAWSPDFGFIPTEPNVIRIAGAAARTLAKAAKLAWVETPVRIANPFDSWLASVLLRTRADLELSGAWPAKADLLTDLVRKGVEYAGSLPLSAIARAAQERAAVERQMARLFENIDILFTPVTAVVSLPAEGPIPDTIVGRDATHCGVESHLMVANLTWQPAISVPAGRTESGFPVGLQIVCARWRDDVALRLARILEQTQPWPLRAPQFKT